MNIIPSFKTIQDAFKFFLILKIQYQLLWCSSKPNKVRKGKISESRGGKEVNNLRVMGSLCRWSCFSLSHLQASKLLPSLSSGSAGEEESEDRVRTIKNVWVFPAYEIPSCMLTHCSFRWQSRKGGIILYSTRIYEFSAWRWWHMTSWPSPSPTGRGHTTHKSCQNPVFSWTCPILQLYLISSLVALFFQSPGLLPPILSSKGPTWPAPLQVPSPLVYFTFPHWWHWAPSNLPTVWFQDCMSFLPLL